MQTGRRDHRESHHGADHHHFAMREVDQLDDAVHHGVAQSDHGVHASCGEAIHQLLQESIHARRLA
jgi:hypothetical protein